jgi:hypothetical protein
MISLLAVLLGGDKRAVRLAQRITYAVTWFSDLEALRFMKFLDEVVDEIVATFRKAA